MMPAVLESSSETKKARKSRRRRVSSVEQVMAVLSAAQVWAETNDRLARVYVSYDEANGVFCLRAVSAHATYDFELTKSVTDLAIALTDRGIDTIGSRLPDVPPDEMTAFFDPSNSLVIHRR